MQFIKQDGLLSLRDLLDATKDCKADDIVYLSDSHNNTVKYMLLYNNIAFIANPIVEARFSDADKRIYLKAQHHNEKDALEISYFRAIPEVYLDVELFDLDDIERDTFDCVTMGHGKIILS